MPNSDWKINKKHGSVAEEFVSFYNLIKFISPAKYSSNLNVFFWASDRTYIQSNVNMYL
jgi:hypothetical protein